jgi:hypothetical protein
MIEGFGNNQSWNNVKIQIWPMASPALDVNSPQTAGQIA